VLSLTGAPTACVISVEMSTDGSSWTPVLTFTLVVASAKGGYTQKTLKTCRSTRSCRRSTPSPVAPRPASTTRSSLAASPDPCPSRSTLRAAAHDPRSDPGASAPEHHLRGRRAVAVYQAGHPEARAAQDRHARPLVHSHGVGDQRPVSSDLIYAVPQEAGAFIAPKSGTTLKFAGSGGVHFQRKPIRSSPAIRRPDVSSLTDKAFGAFAREIDQALD